MITKILDFFFPLSEEDKELTKFVKEIHKSENIKITTSTLGGFGIHREFDEDDIKYIQEAREKAALIVDGEINE